MPKPDLCPERYEGEIRIKQYYSSSISVDLYELPKALGHLHAPRDR
jgi:hypothetical protein